MAISLNGIVIILGNYGSGKTEVAVNLALFMKHQGMDVAIADLDVINLYFRTRDARSLLERHHIPIILPEQEYLHADFPALSPRIAALIKNPSALTILDCGGNEKGASILGTFNTLFQKKTLNILIVVNPFRPDTDQPAACIALKHQVETASRQKVTGWIGNANLIEETTPDQIMEGYGFVQTLSRESNLPVAFITVPDRLCPAIEKQKLNVPVLPLTRHLPLPWKKGDG